MTTTWPKGAPIQPTLGQMIRALRLRWGWSERHRAFIRITSLATGDKRILIELHPLGLVPSAPGRHAKGRPHVCWYDGDADEQRELLDSVQCLRMISAVKEPWAFVVNYEGDFEGLA